MSDINGLQSKNIADDSDRLPIQQTDGQTLNLSVGDLLDPIRSDLADLSGSIDGLSASLPNYALVSSIGQASGIASLGSDGKVPSSQLPTLSGGGSSDSDWIVTATNIAATAGSKIIAVADASITLPSSASAGDWVQVARYDCDVTIALDRLEGIDLDAVFLRGNNPVRRATLIWIDSTVGWIDLDRATQNNWVIPFNSNTPTDGVIHWLGTNRGTQSWTNPAGGSIQLLSSGIGVGQINQLTDRTIQSWYTTNIQNAWVAVDFRDLTVKIDNYSITGRTASSLQHFPRNWTLEGSNNVFDWTVAAVNAATWTAIDVRTSDATINSEGQRYTLTANQSNANSYRYLRLRQSGLNSNNDTYFTICEIEFFGVVSE
jgi:hypothetical protein